MLHINLNMLDLCDLSLTMYDLLQLNILLQFITEKNI